MLAVISPAKTLDFTTPIPVISATQSVFMAQSAELVEICKKFTPDTLASLMHISDKLAGLNVARFAEWNNIHNDENARPAIFAFKGDVYTGLAVEKLSLDDIAFAEQHLCMLSGLYGVLRPLDRIQPHRLEMGTKLANPKGKDLYAFWGNAITEQLQQNINNQGDDVLINLASDEYFKAVKPEKLQARIIKPIFLDYKNGTYKVISLYAKKARGLMCRYLIQQRLTDPEALKEFDLEGYAFSQTESRANEWVFKRHLHK